MGKIRSFPGFELFFPNFLGGPISGPISGAFFFLFRAGGPKLIFTQMAGSQATRPESACGWVLIGWALGRSLNGRRFCHLQTTLRAFLRNIATPNVHSWIAFELSSRHANLRRFSYHTAGFPRQSPVICPCVLNPGAWHKQSFHSCHAELHNESGVCQGQHRQMITLANKWVQHVSWGDDCHKCPKVGFGVDFGRKWI